MFKSTDGGGTWSGANTGLPATSTVHALAIDPDDAQHALRRDRTRGVFKSTDGGGTWSAANTGLPDASSSPRSPSIPPRPSTLYAGTRIGGGVFKSTDGGSTWSAANTGPAQHIASPRSPSIPPRPSTLYAGTGGGRVCDSGQPVRRRL